MYACGLVAQLCPTLRDPMDYSLSGSSVYGILQARILEWVAIPFSRGSSRLKDRTWVFCIADRLLSETSWKPYLYETSLFKSLYDCTSCLDSDCCNSLLPSHSFFYCTNHNCIFICGSISPCQSLPLIKAETEQ